MNKLKKELVNFQVYESLEAGKWLHEEKFELTAFSPSVKVSTTVNNSGGTENQQ